MTPSIRLYCHSGSGGRTSRRQCSALSGLTHDVRCFQDLCDSGRSTHAPRSKARNPAVFLLVLVLLVQERACFLEYPHAEPVGRRSAWRPHSASACLRRLVGRFVVDADFTRVGQRGDVHHHDCGPGRRSIVFSEPGASRRPDGGVQEQPQHCSQDPAQHRRISHHRHSTEHDQPAGAAACRRHPLPLLASSGNGWHRERLVGYGAACVSGTLLRRVLSPAPATRSALADVTRIEATDVARLFACVFRSREQLVRQSIGLLFEPGFNGIEALVEVSPQRAGVPDTGDEYAADERE